MPRFAPMFAVLVVLAGPGSAEESAKDSPFYFKECAPHGDVPYMRLNDLRTRVKADFEKNGYPAADAPLSDRGGWSLAASDAWTVLRDAHGAAVGLKGPETTQRFPSAWVRKTGDSRAGDYDPLDEASGMLARTGGWAAYSDGAFTFRRPKGWTVAADTTTAWGGIDAKSFAALRTTLTVDASKGPEEGRAAVTHEVLARQESASLRLAPWVGREHWAGKNLRFKQSNLGIPGLEGCALGVFELDSCLPGEAKDAPCRHPEVGVECDRRAEGSLGVYATLSGYGTVRTQDDVRRAVQPLYDLLCTIGR